MRCGDARLPVAEFAFEERHDQDVVILAVLEEGIPEASFGNEAHLLVDVPGALVGGIDLELDTVEDVGTAKGGVLEFKGVPILAAPYFTFPLSDKRKSGVLPPSLTIDSQSGVQLTAPYYLNLAPNMDATLAPSLMTKRGVDLAGEFRYLQPSYTGRLRAAFMPSGDVSLHLRLPVIGVLAIYLVVTYSP